MESLQIGFGKLARSRKFMTVAIDTLVSLVIFFATRWLAPQAVDDIKYLIVALQPLAALVLVAWTVEDVTVRIAQMREAIAESAVKAQAKGRK